MMIDNTILDNLTAQAKASPRQRLNLNFQQSLDERCHRFLNAVELVFVIFKFKEGPCVPHEEEGILTIDNYEGVKVWDEICGCLWHKTENNIIQRGNGCFTCHPFELLGIISYSTPFPKTFCQFSIIRRFLPLSCRIMVAGIIPNRFRGFHSSEINMTKWSVCFLYYKMC